VRIASYIMATHFRPKLLDLCLTRIRSSIVPPDWKLEIVVAATESDESGIAVARKHDVVLTTTTATGPGAKLSAAFYASRGNIIFVTGDDDLQSPNRLGCALRRHEDGAKICGIRKFRFLNLLTGMSTIWDGPSARVGAGRSYTRDVIADIGAWKDLPRGIDTDLQNRLDNAQRYYKEEQLGDGIGLDTVCLQHDANIWSDRQFPIKGETIKRGDFRIHGEGHYTEITDFPRDVRKLLKLPRFRRGSMEWHLAKIERRLRNIERRLEGAL